MVKKSETEESRKKKQKKTIFIFLIAVAVICASLVFLVTSQKQGTDQQKVQLSGLTCFLSDDWKQKNISDEEDATEYEVEYRNPKTKDVFDITVYYRKDFSGSLQTVENNLVDEYNHIKDTDGTKTTKTISVDGIKSAEYDIIDRYSRKTKRYNQFVHTLAGDDLYVITYRTNGSTPRKDGGLEDILNTVSLVAE